MGHSYVKSEFLNVLSGADLQIYREHGNLCKA